MGSGDMKHDNVMGLYRKYHEDKSGGIKRQPLNLLPECCEAAGITVAKYHSLTMKHPNPPKAITKVKSLQGKMYIKKDVVKWIKECLEKDKMK
jgi:hypothetical protein